MGRGSKGKGKGNGKEKVENGKEKWPERGKRKGKVGLKEEKDKKVAGKRKKIIKGGGK